VPVVLGDRQTAYRIVNRATGTALTVVRGEEKTPVFLCLVLARSDADQNLVPRFDRARTAVHGFPPSSLAG
jgi:hypothetical protein